MLPTGFLLILLVLIELLIEINKDENINIGHRKYKKRIEEF